MNAPIEVKKIVRLNFPPESSNEPLISNLVRRYDLTCNILQASISPNNEGNLTLELSGEATHYRSGIEYLRKAGVSVRLVSRSVSRNEKMCMHCGTCTTLCPTRALSVDRSSRSIVFEKNLCTACGQCARICPVHVMLVETPD